MLGDAARHAVGERRVGARDAQLALFSRDGEDITVEANNDAVFLVLSGEPIDEPVVGYGPFVMNTQAEIVQAFADFR